MLKQNRNTDFPWDRKPICHGTNEKNEVFSVMLIKTAGKFVFSWSRSNMSNGNFQVRYRKLHVHQNQI